MYPDSCARGARARLVVLGLEAGGPWSRESWTFVQLLARARGRSVPWVVRKSSVLAWQRRWVSLLSVTAARSFAESLLELGTTACADGAVPSSAAVLEDARHEVA